MPENLKGHWPRLGVWVTDECMGHGHPDQGNVALALALAVAAACSFKIEQEPGSGAASMPCAKWVGFGTRDPLSRTFGPSENGSVKIPHQVERVQQRFVRQMDVLGSLMPHGSH
uniref:HDC06266 n=1 Tax=Drosophila melanogaster TaxID=7227 RepID=Q6IGH2_DROME|nr:TPA_inf: HDC06266 [Drosophila melanogaster]